MHRFSTIQVDEMEDAFNSALSRGYELVDFNSYERSSPNVAFGGFYVVEGTLKVTYRPNQTTKVYRTGQGSSWPSEFERDLVAGVFGPPKHLRA